MNFPQNLKRLRKNAKLSQTQLAKRLKMAQSTIGMWETGKREPKLKELPRIAKALNISVIELVK